MPFTFIKFRASPPTVGVTNPCSAMPCSSGGTVDLVADVEVSGNPQLDVTYAITYGHARFCRNGTSEITITDVSAPRISEGVRFCRGEDMSSGYDSITVVATIRERGGPSQSREAVITVRPLEPGREDGPGPTR